VSRYQHHVVESGAMGEGWEVVRGGGGWNGEYALDDLGSNDLARSAPGSEAVEDKELVFDLERLGPLALAAFC
jgi:hypothetical protein